MNQTTDRSPFLMDPFATAMDKNILRRHDQTIRFVQDRLGRRVLDIGERNPLTIRLEREFGVRIESTHGDLDTISLDGVYDTVCCFEVIEHLMNPLRLLTEIRRVIVHQGSLFLSTPKHKPHFLWDRHHFTELDERRLQTLVTRAGFRIERQDQFRTMPFWWYLTGLRPFIRMFHNQVFILELTPQISDSNTNDQPR